MAGTATEVGKTWVTAQWLRGEPGAAARKPVQSFAPGDEGGTDADVLAAATGDRPDAVTPRHRWYEVPMAPPMAADVLGRPAFTVPDLVAEIAWPQSGAHLGVVETVGGVRSPIAADGDSLALAAALQPDAIVLVADADLGTINNVRLSVGALVAVAPVTVFLNRFDIGDELHRRNRDWLIDVDRFEVVTAVDAL